MSEWVNDFLSEPTSQLFCEIDEDYIRDAFNVYGLRERMTGMSSAYKLILENKNHGKSSSDRRRIERQARVLYGLIHARFLMTDEGIDAMFKKWRRNNFPKCPRVNCQNTTCLPYGVSDEPGESPVKFYCPNCNDVYNCTEELFKGVDGAYFGTAWVHMMQMKYSVIVKNPKKEIYTSDSEISESSSSSSSSSCYSDSDYSSRTSSSK